MKLLFQRTGKVVLVEFEFQTPVVFLDPFTFQSSIVKGPSIEPYENLRSALEYATSGFSDVLVNSVPLVGTLHSIRFITNQIVFSFSRVVPTVISKLSLRFQIGVPGSTNQTKTTIYLEPQSLSCNQGVGDPTNKVCLTLYPDLMDILSRIEPTYLIGVPLFASGVEPSLPNVEHYGIPIPIRNMTVEDKLCTFDIPMIYNPIGQWFLQGTPKNSIWNPFSMQVNPSARKKHSFIGLYAFWAMFLFVVVFVGTLFYRSRFRSIGSESNSLSWNTSMSS